MILFYSRIGIHWCWLLQEIMWSIYCPKVRFKSVIYFGSLLASCFRNMLSSKFSSWGGSNNEFRYTLQPPDPDVEPQYRYISANQYLSVIYSGESMENALRACCKGIKIGKILIHRDGDNGKQVKFRVYPIRNSTQYMRITFQLSLNIALAVPTYAAYIWEAPQGYFRTACPSSRSCSCYR